ncbi:UPF0561 protein C2orf68 homolog [Echinops telfairi]|uniref:UPF0561 protein C2orf68 homolog n=1 Tax=Echinops telfairi TaxID=9371 RepID=A0AC55CQ72_ECHTE|nr:UPF0561 protein C2orf68 homolog [Echinops telfairi]
MDAAPDPGQGLCCKPGGRLDMSHGFVHHIRQIRTLFAGCLPALSSLWAGAPPASPSSLSLWFIPPDGSTHPSNPDYEESGESSSSGGSELEPSGHQLFCLEYEADSGEVTSVIVYQDDDPGRVSEEVSAHTPLDPLMRDALKLRVQEEIAKRQSKH